jgi:annexin A7/11
MKGVGTDEKVLIEQIASRSNADLVELVKVYKKTQDRDLIADVASETGGNFKIFLTALLRTRAEYDAESIRTAIKGAGTDNDALIEIICMRTPGELRDCAAAFAALYKKELVKEVADDVSGDYGKLIVSLITNARDKMPEKAQFAADIQALFAAGEGKLGTNEKVWIDIFSSRPRAYLEALAQEYGNKHGKRLEPVIESEFSGNIKKTLLALVTPIPDYIAARLVKSMKGAGTNDASLIRLIAGNKGRQLKQVGQIFLKENKATLASWVESETSGDYRKAILETIKHFA